MSLPSTRHSPRTRGSRHIASGDIRINVDLRARRPAGLNSSRVAISGHPATPAGHEPRFVRPTPRAAYGTCATPRYQTAETGIQIVMEDVRELCGRDRPAKPRAARDHPRQPRQLREPSTSRRNVRERDPIDHRQQVGRAPRCRGVCFEITISVVDFAGNVFATRASTAGFTASGRG